MLKTLDFTILIGSTRTFLYFYLITTIKDRLTKFVLVAKFGNNEHSVWRSEIQNSVYKCLPFPQLSIRFPSYPYISPAIHTFPSYPYVSPAIHTFPQLSIRFPSYPYVSPAIHTFPQLSIRFPSYPW